VEEPNLSPGSRSDEESLNSKGEWESQECLPIGRILLWAQWLDPHVTTILSHWLGAAWKKHDLRLEAETDSGFQLNGKLILQPL
jgi:hypothetical protein